MTCVRHLRLLVALAAAAGALAAAQPASAAVCGLPDQAPLWIDFADGSVQFRASLFGQPGIVAATTGTAVAQQLRGGGAATTYWEMRLDSLVGSAVSPADPNAIGPVAAAELVKAQQSTACATPTIALNELQGSNAAMPWSAATVRYRSAVLALLGQLRALGATPVLLVPFPFASTGQAGDWWRAAGQVAVLVPEVYFDAPTIAAQGPLIGSRTLRVAFRGAIDQLVAAGVPVSQIGLMLGFMSGTGMQGREGLQPTAAWLQVVKLQALAARQVAADYPGLQSIWSWGWGTFAIPGSADPDKAAAACVYLWTRSPTLCPTALTVAGAGFDPSLDAGQIALAAGIQCQWANGSIASADLAALQTAYGGQRALSELLERALVRRAAYVGPTGPRKAERGVIARDFAGSRPRYLAALATAGVTPDVASAVLTDEIAVRRLTAALPIAPLRDRDVKAYAHSHAGLRVRPVQVSPAVAWLGGRGTGVAVPGLAPAQVFSLPAGRTTVLHTTQGAIRVRPLGPAKPLRHYALGDVSTSLRALLQAPLRRIAYAAWLSGKAAAAMQTATCLRDQLPTPGDDPLPASLRFLRLDP